MELTAIRTPLIEKGADLFDVFLGSLDQDLRDGDVVSVTSKVVAVEQERLVELSSVTPSQEALRMRKLRYSKDFEQHPQFAELVVRESEKLFEGPKGFVYLTLKEYVFIANAGIDLSNVPEGYAVLWPEEPWTWASEFRRRLMDHFSLGELGVLMTDSHLVPLRRGVTGIALAFSGFEGVESQIGKPDLYGRPLQVTEKAVADDLASAVVLLTGEAAERTPFALIRGAPIEFTDREIDPLETFINPKLDLYAGIYNEEFRSLLDVPMPPLPRGGQIAEHE